MLGTNGVQYLRGQETPGAATTPTPLHRKSTTTRHTSGAAVLDTFLQRAIDARDVALVTAAVRVAKDLVSGDDNNDAVLHDDTESTGLIQRAEAYLAVLRQQRLSQEAMAALAHRRTTDPPDASPPLAVSRSKEDVTFDAVDAFVEDFHTQYRQALLHCTSDDDNVQVATPGGGDDGDGSGKRATDTAALVTPYASMPPRPLKPPATVDTTPPPEHLQCFASPHPGANADTTSPQAADVIADAGSYVAGAFAGMLYGVGTMLGGDAAASPNTVATAVSVPTPDSARAQRAESSNSSNSGGGLKKADPAGPGPGAVASLSGAVPSAPLRVAHTVGSSLMAASAPVPAPAATTSAGAGAGGAGGTGWGGEETGLGVDYAALAADFDDVLTPPSFRHPPATAPTQPPSGSDRAGTGEKTPGKVGSLGSRPLKTRPMNYDPSQVRNCTHKHPAPSIGLGPDLS